MSRARAHAGTPVTLTVDGIAIPATLNGTRTAQSFAENLPFSITLRRYESDYCTPTRPLPVKESETQHGWANGDIGLFGGWFTLLFAGEEHSRSTPGVMVIGRIGDGALETVRRLPETISLTVARQA